MKTFYIVQVKIEIVSCTIKNRNLNIILRGLYQEASARDVYAHFIAENNHFIIWEKILINISSPRLWAWQIEERNCPKRTWICHRVSRSESWVAKIMRILLLAQSLYTMREVAMRSVCRVGLLERLKTENWGFPFV